LDAPYSVVTFAHLILCQSLVHAGQYHHARQQLTDILCLTGDVGIPTREAQRYWIVGQLALVETSYSEAQAAFAESAKFFQKVRPDKMGLALAGQGYAAYHLGQLPEACRYVAEALSSALTFASYLPNVFTLPGVALLLAVTGNIVRAVEVWTLAKCHPYVANSKWFEDVAGRELEALAASLPLEVAEVARERGRALDLWETSRLLLNELG
jgi:hypothetical protein